PLAAAQSANAEVTGLGVCGTRGGLIMSRPVNQIRRVTYLWPHRKASETAYGRARVLSRQQPRIGNQSSRGWSQRRRGPALSLHSPVSKSRVKAPVSQPGVLA